MALLNIRQEGDPILRGKSREVTEINDRILTLLDDMKETLHRAEGVGLAAPQVGVKRRVVLVETEPGELIELINPVIVETEGEQFGSEGCLSVPGLQGNVRRPMKVTVKALNRKGEEITVTGEELKARALCHEIDHLDGILYIDKAEEVYSIEKDEDE